MRLRRLQGDVAAAGEQPLDLLQADLWRIGGIFVLTLSGEEIAAITRFGEGGWLPWFGLPRTLPGGDGG